MYKELGFKIIEEINRPGSIDELQSIRLADKYVNYSKDDLAVTHTLIVAEKI